MSSLRDYISSKEASERYALTQDYLSFLASKGTIKGVKIARNWLIFVPSLEEYLKHRPKPGPKLGSHRKSKAQRS